MNPVAFDTDAFMRAKVAPTYHHEDGGAQNDAALWWRLNIPVPGATWNLNFCGRAAPGGPAVVDDFGDLVLVRHWP